MRTIGKLRVKYSKKEPLKFLSHLEVVSAIRQSVRRADLPVCFSEGFSPQLKISFGPPLAVGYTSDCEIFDMEMENRIDAELVKKRLVENTPEDLNVLSVSVVPLDVKAIELFINVSKYSIELPNIDKEIITNKIKEFFDSKEFIIERLTDKSKREIDVRPLVITMKLAPLENSTDRVSSEINNDLKSQPYNIDAARSSLTGLVESKIEMLLRFGPGKTAKPDVIVQKLFNLSNEERLSLKINRDEIYHENEMGGIVLQ